MNGLGAFASADCLIGETSRVATSSNAFTVETVFPHIHHHEEKAESIMH